MIRSAPDLRHTCLLLAGALPLFFCSQLNGQPAPAKQPLPLEDVPVNPAGNPGGGDQWVENATAKKELVPSQPNQPLGLPSFRSDDAIVTPFKLPNPNQVAWGSNYKCFFTCEQNVIRRIRFPELIEDFRLETEFPISSMAVSSAGLLFRTEGELCLHSEEDLKHIRTLKFAGRGAITAVPRSPIALINNESGLAIVNTATGTVLRNQSEQGYQMSDPANVGLTLRAGRYSADGNYLGLYMTPDGKHVVSPAPLTVLKITSDNLVVVAKDKELHGVFFSFSSDSRYFALKKTGGEIGIYRTLDPSKEIRSLTRKDWLSFDPAAGVMYSSVKEEGDASHSILILGKRGGRIKSYKLENPVVDKGTKRLDWHFAHFEEALVYPGGRNLLLFSHGNGCWFQYPELGDKPGTASDWLEQPETSGVAGLSPVASERPLRGTTSVVDGLTVTPIQLAPSDLYSRPVWAGDYRSFFTVSDEGVIRKISFPGCIEQRVFDLQSIDVKLAVSSAGLVAFAPRLKSIFVLDPDSLAVKRTIRECNGTSIAATPVSQFLYSTDPSGGTLWIYDTATAARVAEINAQTLYDKELPRLASNKRNDGSLTFATLALSPDGKYLLGGRQSVHRLKAWPAVSYEEIGKGMQDSVASIWPSGDTAYVAACGHGKTYIYKMQDLSEPLLTIPMYGIKEVVFEKASKTLYLLVENVLILSSLDGTEKKIPLEQTFTGLLHYPGGNNLLAWSEGKGLLWIQVPKAAK